jgi:hypothetical protein
MWEDSLLPKDTLLDLSIALVLYKNYKVSEMGSILVSVWRRRQNILAT